MSFVAAHPISSQQEEAAASGGCPEWQEKAGEISCGETCDSAASAREQPVMAGGQPWQKNGTTNE